MSVQPPGSVDKDAKISYPQDSGRLKAYSDFELLEGLLQ